MADVGHVRKLADGKYWVKVQHGYRSDGKPRVKTATVYGTEREARMRAAELAQQMGASLACGDNLTLSDYYWRVFRLGNSNRGKPRSKSTLRMYDAEFAKHIEPVVGDMRLNDIKHAHIRRCVEDSPCQDRTKRVLRAVLRKAYDDEFLEEEPFRRRVPTRTVKKEQVQPWTVPEAAEALEAFRAVDPRLEMYLIYGLSGMRKEEALGQRPCDYVVTRAYDVATGEMVDTEQFRIKQVYTAEDGVKETKTDFSERAVPVLYVARGRFRELLASTRPDTRGMPERAAEAAMKGWLAARVVSISNFNRSWRRAVARLGLRYVPPDLLRHTSETIMQAAALPDTLVSRMHGHTDVRTDYRHYLRPGADSMEMAARKVADLYKDAL